MGGQPWTELELHDRPWECSLERGERRKKRVKEWGSFGAHHGGCLGTACCCMKALGCCSVRGSLLRVRKEIEREEKRKEKKKGKKEKKRKEIFSEHGNF
jgi:hypothetical protein